MEQLSIQKRLRAPFNQKENLLEIIVNNNTAVIVNTVWTKRQITAFGFSFLPDSLAIAGAIEKVAFNKNYIAGVATIQNYCMAVLKTQKMDLRNTEVKMVIAQKLIRPFREMNNLGYLPTETIVFETTLLHAIL